MAQKAGISLTTVGCLLFCFTSLYAQNTADTSKRISGNEKRPDYLVNPAVWIDNCYNQLNEIYLYQAEHDLDTNELFDNFRQHLVVVTMLKNSFYGHSSSLNIRSVDNMKMRLASILADIGRWNRIVHNKNEILVNKANVVIRIKNEIREFREQSDSIFQNNFEESANRLSVRQRAAEAIVLKELRAGTAIENRIVEINTQVYVFNSDVLHLLQVKEVGLINMELPPVWRSPPGIYPNSLPDVLAASFRQTLESVKYYGEMELWRIVIFRGLIVLLCMIPIKLFNDERRKNKILSDTNLTFLARFPKTASLVMGMSLAPFIFVNPPHAFMEFILLGLTFTVTTLTLQNYPKTNKPILITLIAAFMVLYLINFFVTPTFIGRLIYTSSIFLLVPLFLMNKKISTFELKYEKTTRVFLLFMAVHLVAGWVCVILGYYTLGRSIILASYSLLILTMILRIAIYTLLDYVEILSYFFNNRVRTVRINTAYVHRKTKPLLILFSILFLVMAYLYNMNVFDLVRSGLHDFMVTPRKIGSSTFDYLSVFLFFASVYLAFLIASIIRNAFDPSHDHTVEHRSNLGSYLLLFRLLILITGFTVGILASGLPLTNFAILLGAMGVGIGLGLQNIISNLVSGLIIAFERPFVVGDVLDFEKESCTVKEISLRATQVSTSDGANILIPNNTLLSANLKNWTISTKQRLLEVKVLTGHDVKPETVIEIISGCLNDDGNIIRKKSVVLLSEINDTGMVFVVKVLITNLSNASSIKSQLLSSIHAEFTSHNIRFPRNKSSVND